MKIDPRTKENFKAACLNQSAVAKSIGVTVSLFNQVVNGTYPNPEGKEATKAVNFLRERGLLVLEGEADFLAADTIATSEAIAITSH